MKIRSSARGRRPATGSGPPSPRLAWRVGRSLYSQDADFARLRAFLRRHRCAVDEVAFFETFSHHLYLPLADCRRTARILRRRIRILKHDGIPQVGINILTTLGHVNEGWDVLPPLPFPPMVGHDGARSRGCACPNTAALREYVRAKYRLFAAAAPDFIWVDDDLRLQHHGVAYPCFCRACLTRFGRATGRTWDRVTLVRALNRLRNGALRAAWVQQNSRSLTELLALVRAAVHGVNPSIRTGLMTTDVTWGSYSGPDLERWCGALGATKARPGGGFYDDARPWGQFEKALATGRQCASYPAGVTDRQYELENFPYTALGKSAHSVVTECTLALAAGCNGIAFNALAISAVHTLADKDPLATAVERARPFWKWLLDRIGGAPLAGYWPAWHPSFLARCRVRSGEDWFGIGGGDENRPTVLARLGLALTAARTEGGVILAGRSAEAFTDAELRSMLSGPVLLDGTVLENLQARGLADLAGARVHRWLDNGVAERFTADPLNRPHRRAIRDIRLEFWGDPSLRAAWLRPTRRGVRVVSELETYLGKRVGPCLTAYENDLGGRVVTMGYAPWRFVDGLGKRAQLINAADWACRHRLPVLIRETVPLVPLVRRSADGRQGAVVLLNAGLDPIPAATVLVRGSPTRVRWIQPGHPARRLAPRPASRGWTVTLRDLGPWQVGALLLG